MRAYATVHTEDITAVFSATLVRDHYGVPGSPVWMSPEDIKLESVTILEVDVLPKSLPPALEDAIYDLIDDIEEWEE